jgi:hypothetical protein
MFTNWHLPGIEKCLSATNLSFSLNDKYDSAPVCVKLAVHCGVQAGNYKRLWLAYLNRADVYKNLEN